MVGAVGESGVGGSEVVDITIEGRRILLRPLSLACCAVEAAEALRWLADYRTSGDQAVSAALSRPDLHVLLVAGTVTKPLLPEVETAWAALPSPRRAIAFGACTISGGPYWDSYAVVPGVLDVLGDAIAVPGCPPRPDTLLDAVKLAVESA